MDAAPIPQSAEPPSPASTEPPPVRPTLVQLFVAFATISLSGFGGVLAWARRMVVEERHWLTPEEFNETFALCSFLPGGNIINFSIIFGLRIRGVLGSLVAVAGLLGPPFLLVLFVGALYAHYGDAPALRRMLIGVAAAAAGLLMATVAKMAQPLFRSGTIAAPLIALATFIAIGIVHWPLPLVLMALLPVSVAIAWVRP